MTPRIVLLHGVATTATVWERVVPALADAGLDDVTAIARPCSGSLADELAHLRPLVEDAVVVGQSGGATLTLALASSGARLSGAIAHEPAVGSLAPHLLAPAAAAFARGGVAAFGSALYGSSWTPPMAGADADAVERELPMFRAFEPGPPSAGQGPVLITVGSLSPAIRQDAAAALHDRFGYEIQTLGGAHHFVAWDAPLLFAEVIAGFVGALPVRNRGAAPAKGA